MLSWRRPLVIFASVAVLAIGVGMFSQAAHSQRTQLPQHSHDRHENILTFGISDPTFLGESQTEQTSQLAAMRAVGITSIRLDADWNWVQHDGPHSFDWTQLDDAVHSAREKGMSVDLIIDGCPPWAALPEARHDTAPQPASPAQYATWAADVASRYSPQGVHIFEIWNEPNIRQFWQPSPSPAAYTADLVAAYHAIKAVDRSAFVISGGLAPAPTSEGNYSPIAFLQAIYKDGAKGSFDAVGDHPYTYPAYPDTYGTWSAWSQMDQTTPSIRSIMASHGDGNLPIWITEFGAPSAGPGGIGQAAQAAELTQAIAYAKEKGWIGALYLYTWQDAGANLSQTADWFGLTNRAGVPTPTLAAVAEKIK